MESMDNFRDRFEALAQQTEPLKHQTHVRACQAYWWRGIWRGAAVAALGLALASPPPVQAKTSAPPTVPYWSAGSRSKHGLLCMAPSSSLPLCERV
jgi:hypothetical protein